MKENRLDTVDSKGFYNPLIKTEFQAELKKDVDVVKCIRQAEQLKQLINARITGSIGFLSQGTRQFPFVQGNFSSGFIGTDSKSFIYDPIALIQSLKPEGAPYPEPCYACLTYIHSLWHNLCGHTMINDTAYGHLVCQKVLQMCSSMNLVKDPSASVDYYNLNNAGKRLVYSIWGLACDICVTAILVDHVIHVSAQDLNRIVTRNDIGYLVPVNTSLNAHTIEETTRIKNNYQKYVMRTEDQRQSLRDIVKQVTKNHGSNSTKILNVFEPLRIFAFLNDLIQAQGMNALKPYYNMMLDNHEMWPVAKNFADYVNDPNSNGQGEKGDGGSNGGQSNDQSNSGQDDDNSNGDSSGKGNGKSDSKKGQGKGPKDSDQQNKDGTGGDDQNQQTGGKGDKDPNQQTDGDGGSSQPSPQETEEFGGDSKGDQKNQAGSSDSGGGFDINNNSNQQGNQTGNGTQTGYQSKSEIQKQTSNIIEESKAKDWKTTLKLVKSQMETTYREVFQNSENMKDTLNYLYKEQYDFSTWLRKFSHISEIPEEDEDSFEYGIYDYGARTFGDKLLIEYPETKQDFKIEDFVIALDTSGSCSGEIIKKFINKVYSILTEDKMFAKRLHVHIIQCDCEIREYVVCENLREVDSYLRTFTAKGLGGTDFRPVFDFIESKLRDGSIAKLDGILYFTDGWGSMPTHSLGVKTAFVYLYSDLEHPTTPPWIDDYVIDEKDIDYKSM